MRFYRVKLLRTAAKEIKQQLAYRQTLLAGNHFESLCFPEKQGNTASASWLALIGGTDWKLPLHGGKKERHYGKKRQGGGDCTD